MAMATWLQAVSESRLEELRQHPDSFGQFDAPESYSTYFAPSINYFLAGNAYPSDHELASVLQGAESIKCERLENGYFGIVSAKQAEKLARCLSDVDLDDVRSRIEGSELGELIDEEELEDLELLEHVEVPDKVVDEIKRLAAFYDLVAKAGLGVTMYTA